MSAPPSSSEEPRYVRLHASGELAARIERGRELLAHCTACPRLCGVNRMAGERGYCGAGRWARMASACAHLGEEDCLRGWKGSGAIFFGGCNLGCVFCQNFDISQRETGREVSPEVLAGLMIELQGAGCHNINWVTPEHVAPQLLEAMPAAVSGGLRLPIVYNTSAYDGLESLRLMDGVVDIYMPDFKYWDRGKAGLYLKAPGYPEAARAAIREMHRQVGDLVIDGHGLARRGLLVRHLVMPGAAEDTAAIMAFLAEEISADTFVNVMGQYHPAGLVADDPAAFPEIARRVTTREMEEAYRAAASAGLHRFDGR